MDRVRNKEVTGMTLTCANIWATNGQKSPAKVDGVFEKLEKESYNHYPRKSLSSKN